MFGLKTYERGWTIRQDVNGTIIRESLIELGNPSALGYVVKLGYDKWIKKKFKVGARVDWSNSEIDGYAGYGIAFGVRL